MQRTQVGGEAVSTMDPKAVYVQTRHQSSSCPSHVASDLKGHNTGIKICETLEHL